MISLSESETAFIAALKGQLSPEATAEFREPEQRLLIGAMRLVGMATYPPVTGDPYGDRAGGDCLCSRCNMPYSRHPFDWRAVGYGNVPFLNVLCDGQRVKL